SRCTGDPAATCATTPARRCSASATGTPSRSTSWTSRPTKICCAATSSASRWSVSTETSPTTSRSTSTTSHAASVYCERGNELRRCRDQLGWRRAVRRRGDGTAVRSPFAWRGGAALALPAGADAGAQDGQGDDLLPGALRVHARQLNA